MSNTITEFDVMHNWFTLASSSILYFVVKMNTINKILPYFFSFNEAFKLAIYKIFNELKYFFCI